MHAPWPAPGTPIDYSHLSVNPTSLACPPPAVAATAEAPPIARTVATPGPGIEREPRASEPMMAVGQGFMLVNAYRATGWPGTADEVWLRPTVVGRLVAARAALPSGFGLAIYDGWRSPETVRALYAHYYGNGSTLEPGFLADPDRPGPPPPHLTGAAVDLTLTWSGHALSLGTPFDEFSDRAHLASLEAADEGPDRVARDLRRVLHAAMTGAGFAPFDAEWWHFSWGDDDWARWWGLDRAFFGVTEPPQAHR